MASRRSTLKRFTVSAAVCALSCASLQAQTTPPTTPTLTTQSNLVVVPALVTDKTGHPVFGLNATDFVLTDNGIPQKLTLEQDTDGEPLALVVLIEAGAANRGSGWKPNTNTPPPDRLHTLPIMVDALTGNVPRRIAVVGFDSGPELLQPFTANVDKVTAAIDDMNAHIDGDGGAAILDALQYSLGLLRAQPPQYRRAILLLSETNDRGSKTQLDDAVRAISDTNTAIYSLAFSTDNTKASEYASRQLPTKREPCHAEDDFCLWLRNLESSGNLSKALSGGLLDVLLNGGIAVSNPNPGPAHGCMSASDPDAPVAKNPAVRAYDCLGQLLPPFALAKVAAIAASVDLERNVPQTVARLTGGEYYKLTDARSMETSLLAISNHIPNRYILSFQPQSPQFGFHLITLRLPNDADIKVSARNGYWADPTPTPTH